MAPGAAAAEEKNDDNDLRALMDTILKKIDEQLEAIKRLEVRMASWQRFQLLKRSQRPSRMPGAIGVEVTMPSNPLYEV